MKLEINLADREEIGAAIAMLQMIYDSTMHADVSLRVPAGTAAAIAANPAGAVQALAMAAAPISSGAAVVPAPLPTVAPSSVAVPPPPTAPAVSPVIPPPPMIAPAPIAPAAPPVVAPPAPVATTTPAPVVDLDSRGLPWDERIHASTKAKVQNGTLWKLKRGVEDALVAQVEAELRAAMAARVPNPPAFAPVADGAAAAAAFGGAAVPAPLPPAAIAPPAAPLVPAPPAAPSAAADPTTFETLMPRVSAAAAAGTLPPAALQAACVAQGLPSVVALQTNVAFVPLVWAALKQQYPGLQ